MEAYMINTAKERLTTGPLKKVLLILSCYPYVFASIILLGGSLQSYNLTYFGIASLALYIFFGSIAWMTILVCSLVYNKISLKHVVWNILILFTGIITAYYVFEYDVFSSGAKYMD